MPSGEFNLPTESIMNFAADHITHRMIRGRRVLEIGIEEGLKEHIMFYKPEVFIGINNSKRQGNSVDIKLSVYEIEGYFGSQSFDFVYATEVLEHLEDWRNAITQMKRVTKVGGYVLLSTRSKGYPYHGAAYGDFWRFEQDDLKKIFPDFDIVALKGDTRMPGVLFIGRKSCRHAAALDNIQLFSIITHKRELNSPPFSVRVRLFRTKVLVRELLITLIERMLR